MKCPFCRARNMDGAGFCIECGEPLDERPADGEWAREDRDDPGGDGWAWREKRLELVLGMALLLAVLGFALVSFLRQETQGEHYRAGLNAVEQGDLELALSELEAAGGYLDSGKRAEEARQRVRLRDDLYGEASDAFSEGRYWAASRLLTQLEGLAPGFRGTAPMLQESRDAVGRIVFRLGPWADGVGALYVARADGSDRRRVPGTGRLSEPHAFTPDGRWLLFSEAEWTETDVPIRRRGRTVYLYSIEDRFTQKVVTLSQGESSGSNVGFTRDGMGVRISTRRDDRVYALPTGKAPGEGPLPEVARDDNPYRHDRYRTLVLESVDHGTAVTVGDERGANRTSVAVEPVEPDGAIFSQDGRYLLYRVCGPVLEGAAPGCAVRLVDLYALQPRPANVASLPYKRSDDRRNSVTGEFTRDGKHVFVLSRYNGESEAHLYDIARGTLRRVDAATAVERGPLVSLLAPGITYWARPNSLAYTEETLQFATGPWPGGRDVPYYRIKSHWVEVGPGGRYALYLEGEDVGPSLGDYRMYAVPLDRPTAATQILQITTRLYDWRYSGYLLPEGHTLVTLIPPTPESPRGLYAYDLATGSSTLVVPDAIEMLEPGPRRFTMGDFLRR
ncbi:MAG TPA: zinc ribbon domain-containing protein [Chloroflexia bacterium]|nr:zinc ribbon domain-containing protein [Chloroflexia bacterium]